MKRKLQKRRVNAVLFVLLVEFWFVAPVVALGLLAWFK